MRLSTYSGSYNEDLLNATVCMAGSEAAAPGVPPDGQVPGPSTAPGNEGIGIGGKRQSGLFGPAGTIRLSEPAKDRHYSAA